jgi:hypothetical protein
VRDNQLKIIKYNHLIANLLIFHNYRAITLALKELETEGVRLTLDFYSFTKESFRLPKCLFGSFRAKNDSKRPFRGRLRVNFYTVAATTPTSGS